MIGKVVGHGKGVPLRLFEANRHAIAFEPDAARAAHAAQAVPPPPARRARHALPGGQAPAGGPSVRRSPPTSRRSGSRCSRTGPSTTGCAARSRRTPPTSASTPPATSTTCARCSTSSSPTQPGPLRDTLLLHWYRGKMLGRVGGRDWLWRDDEFRRELYDAVRPLALERFGEDVHDAAAVQPAPALEAAAPRGLRRARPPVALRAPPQAASCASAASSAAARTWCCASSPGSARRRPSCASSARATARSGCRRPSSSRSDAPEEDREVTGELRRSRADVFLRNVEDGSRVPAARPHPARGCSVRETGRVRPKLQTVVPIAPTAAAAGGPLPPGRWEVHITLDGGGLPRAPCPSCGTASRWSSPPTRPGRIVVGDTPPPPPGAAARAYRRLPWPVVGTLRRARAVAARRG